jgi:cell wall-associated NlpC family hydrolase
VPARHLAVIGAVEPDFVAVAERFVGVPYLWGGKTSLGIDCSGLVQIALTAAGIACPRDSDMQERALGAAIAPDPAGLRRGDLFFWKGHVAIVRDATTLLHANAHHMAVASEPIAEAVRRIAAGGSPVTTVKRLQQP